MRIWWLMTHGITPDDALHAMLARQPSLAEALSAGLIVHHPPMMVVLAYLVQTVSLSDISIRLIPALSGVAMPVLFFYWARRRLGTGPACVCLVLLTFSKPIFSLTVQSRGYAIAFLFVSALLFFFDRAVEACSSRSMAAAMVALWAAIMSEFSVVTVCATAGIYAMWRMLETQAPRRLWVIWGAGQLAGIGTYVALWFFQIRHLVHNKADETEAAWLRNLFPIPEESLLRFTLRGTLNQFNFLMSNFPLAILAALAFGAGLLLLWRRGPRSILVLVTLPFALQWLASVAVLLPYGGSRHSSLLALWVSVAIGAAAAWLSLRYQRMLVVALILAVPLWWILAKTNPYDVEPEQLRGLRGVAAYVERSIPKGSVILATGEGNAVLGFYLKAQNWAAQPRTLNTVQHYAGYTVFSQRLAFGAFPDWCGHLKDMVSSYQLDPNAPVWVVDGGFFPSAASRIKLLFGPEAITNVNPFGYLVVYQVLPSRILPRVPSCAVVPKSPFS